MSTFSLLWRLIAYCRWQSFVIAGQLIFGLLIQSFFNAISPVPASHPNSAWFWLLLLVLAVSAQCMMMFVTANISAGINLLQTALVQRNIFARVLAYPGVNAIGDSSGETISRLRDDTASIVGMTGTIVRTIGGLLFAIGAFLILFHTNAIMTLLVFIPLLSTIFIAQKLKERQKKYRRASRKATSDVTGAIGEVFGSVQAIKMAGTETDVASYLRGLNKQRRMLTLKDMVFSNVVQALFGNTADIGKGLILILVAIAFREQTRAGDLALFIVYLGNISECIRVIGGFLAQYAQIKVSQQRLTDLLQRMPAAELVASRESFPVRSQEFSPQPSLARLWRSNLKEIRATGLTYTYPETGRGVRNVNLCLKQNTLTVVTGRVGAGKTTLLRVFLGLLPREQGEISWNGQSISDPAAFLVSPYCAYTPQTPRLFSETLKENILQGLSENMTNLQQALYMAVMEHDINGLEHGLETVVGSRGVKLSGGQLQRAAAARMFVRNAELLVFDDLSSALDVGTESLLWERLFERPVHTCLAVSNRVAVLQKADLILVLRDGEVIDEGRWPELLARCEEVRLVSG
jgi:ATP-binding cassette subfamily B protein